MRKLIYLLFFIGLGLNTYAQDGYLLASYQQEVKSKFIMQITTDGASELFTIPITTAYNNVIINWGDGSALETFTGTSLTMSHTYVSAGTRDVTISGNFSGISATGTQNNKIDNIKQWGYSAFTRMMLYNIRTDVTATDIPNLTAITAIDQIFRDNNNSITAINSIDKWYMSNKTNTRAMFRSSFLSAAKIGNIGAWVGFAPANISEMFQASPSSLNHNLSGWSVANLTNASNFNLLGTAWSTANYEATLIGWAAQAPSIQTGVTLHAGTATVRTAAANAAYTILTGTYGWTIIDSHGTNGGTL